MADVKKMIKEYLKFFSVLVFLHASYVCAQNELDSSDQSHIDTEYGELLYNEASIATRMEMLGLLSKDTPSVLVFMHAISMGLGIEDVLQAAVEYEPENARDFAESAISLLPLLSDSQDYDYPGYDLEDLDRESESESYSVKEVIERFFDNSELLEPQPDWMDGQYHFLASVEELKSLDTTESGVDWYYKKNNTSIPERPIFVSLYESDRSVLIDGEERLLATVPNATLPVVFIFNRNRERAIDQLVDTHKYPRTIRGVQQAYSENALMLTPAPQWKSGEYHIQGQIDEIDELFDIPEENDFEPEHWQRLLISAQEYKDSQPAFLMVVLTGNQGQVKLNRASSRVEYAAYEDPRVEASFPYVMPNHNSDVANDSEPQSEISMRALIGQGLILNRPDLIAALKAIEVKSVPIVFYYIDDARTKRYQLGPRALRTFVSGVQPRGLNGGSGGFGPPPELPGDPIAPPTPVTPPTPDLPDIDDDFSPPPVCASPPCAN